MNNNGQRTLGLDPEGSLCSSIESLNIGQHNSIPATTPPASGTLDSQGGAVPFVIEACADNLSAPDGVVTEPFVTGENHEEFLSSLPSLEAGEESEDSAGRHQLSPSSSTDETGDEPPSKLLVLLIPGHEVFRYLTLEDILETRGICRRMRAEAQLYVLHDLLPLSRIQVSTKSIVYGQVKIESHELLPVIKRVPRRERHLPAGRVVYEPDYDTMTTRYHPNRFTPEKVVFTTPSERTSYHWNLEPLRKRTRHDLPYSRSRQPCLFASESYMRNEKFQVFHQFRIRESKEAIHLPVKVFYKRCGDESPDIKLHAVSIPLDCLLKLIVAKRGLRWNEKQPSQ
jgi:hypothetical protein